MTERAKEIVKIAYKALDEKKAEDIKIIETSNSMKSASGGNVGTGMLMILLGALFTPVIIGVPLLGVGIWMLVS